METRRRSATRCLLACSRRCRKAPPGAARPPCRVPIAISHIRVPGDRRRPDEERGHALRSAGCPASHKCGFMPTPEKANSSCRSWHDHPPRPRSRRTTGASAAAGGASARLREPPAGLSLHVDRSCDADDRAIEGPDRNAALCPLHPRVRRLRARWSA